MMRVLLLVLLSSVPSLSTIFRLREKTLTAGKKRDHVARFFEKREEPSSLGEHSHIVMRRGRSIVAVWTGDSGRTASD